MRNNHSITLTEKLKNKLNIYRENRPSAFIFALVIISNLAAVMLSSLLLLFLPENKGRGFGEMMRFAFTLMVNPSGRYQYSDYPVSLIITTVVVLLGMISLTGGTVGYITSIIMNIIEKSSSSRRKLRLDKHIVILNYNHKVPALIYDYCFDDISSTYIVILADKEKSYIEKQIDDVFSIYGKKKKLFNIIVRNGNPLSKLELDKISLNTAKTVIIMSPEEDGASERSGSYNAQSFAISKLFMFISSYLKKFTASCSPNLIVETPNSDIEKIIREYHDDSDTSGDQMVELVNYNELLGKIFAIVTMMPSLNNALLHMISFEGVEFYIEDIPDGVSVSEDIKRQKSAVPIIDKGGKRVYLAEDENAAGQIKSGAGSEKALSEIKPFKPVVNSEKSKIVIVGSNSKLKYILESLACFKKEFEGTDLDVILMDTEENREQLEKCCSDPAYSILFEGEGSGAVVIKDIFEPLSDLDPHVLDNTNSVLFLSDENCEDGRIDEKPLLFWSRLNNSKVKNSAENTQSWECIVEVLDMQNKDIIESRDRDQVILSEKFLSCLYAQLGKDPKRLEFIRDMVTYENDSSSVNKNNELLNDCSVISVAAGMFFKNYEGPLDFASKRELISGVFEATDHRYLPVGCVKNGVNYLFARTNGSNDDLDTAVLLPKNDDEKLVIRENRLKLDPKDEIIVVKM
jgi:hypothetical protein